ncbi:MAG: GNAT family protein [Tepidisphaeraceae bacterium]|jgi:RimJ/RimL family protein N-acetyltransferase
MLEIVYDREYRPTEVQIRSYYNLLRSPQQMTWEYSDDFGFLRKSVDELAATYAATRRTDRHEIWAVEGQRIVGYAGLEPFAKVEKRHTAELGFGVAEDRVRRGIGFRVVLAAVAKARELGFKRVEGDCLADNVASARLFRKAGFVEEGMRHGAIEKNGRLYDLRLFGLVL